MWNVFFFKPCLFFKNLFYCRDVQKQIIFDSVYPVFVLDTSLLDKSLVILLKMWRILIISVQLYFVLDNLVLTVVPGVKGHHGFTLHELPVGVFSDTSRTLVSHL